MTIPKKIINNDNKSKKKNTSNRVGADFEKRLSVKFEEYRKEGIAYIFKCHTDWVVIRGVGGRISTAYPKKQSDMLDFVAFLPNGKHAIFEAKTCNNKSSFPLSNIKEYQFNLNRELYKYTDDIFYIIEMREHNEVYLLHASDLQSFVDNNERKSIPYDVLKEIAILIEDLDILKYI